MIIVSLIAHRPEAPTAGIPRKVTLLAMESIAELTSQSWYIRPDRLPICKHEDGSDAILGVGAFGQACLPALCCHAAPAMLEALHKQHAPRSRPAMSAFTGCMLAMFASDTTTAKSFA